MNGTSTGPVRAALWARVSTTEQHSQNQTDILHEWAARRGLDLVAEFVTEDSAWQNGNGTKGKEFDRTRDQLINGARLGHYDVVLVWAVDRLSRRGIEDTLATMRRLYEHGCDIWSHQEPWLVTSEPRMRELLVSFMAWVAEQESARRSERVKAGMARVRQEVAEGLSDKKIGGRKAGSKDRKRRRPEGYEDAWRPGGALYEARQRHLAAKKADLLKDPVRLRELRRDVPCEACGAGIGDPCRSTGGKNRGAPLSVRTMHVWRREASDRAFAEKFPEEWAAQLAAENAAQFGADAPAEESGEEATG